MKRSLSAIAIATADSAAAAPVASPLAVIARCPGGSGGIDFSLEDGLAHETGDARTLRFVAP